MRAKWRSVGCLCVVPEFFFLLPSSGRCLAWQPPASNALQVVFDSSPNMGSLVFFPPFFTARSFPMLFYPFQFSVYFLSFFFSQRLFCKEHNIHLPTDKSEFSIEEATERKSPTRCSLPSIRVKKEEPFKPIWNDKSLISPFWWKFSFLPIFEK